MKDIQKIFDDTQKLKKERRELNKEYKYSLDHDEKYQELIEKLKKLREKKKNIEDGSKPIRLDEIKDELVGLNEMISDIAVSTIMSGDSVYLKDEYENEYEPIHKITFKKIK